MEIFNFLTGNYSQSVKSHFFKPYEISCCMNLRSTLASTYSGKDEMV